MAQTKPSSKFKRVYTSLRRAELLTPYLEKELLVRSWRSWPDEYTVKVRNKEREWDGFFHPSIHCQPAALELFYMFHPDIRVEYRERTPTDSLALHIGSVYHAVMESLLVHMGFVEDKDIEVGFVDEDVWCSGTLDCKRTHIPHLTMTPPIDIKSIDHVPKEPPFHYQQQLQVYMDRGCDEPQEIGILLFIEKRTPHRFKEFVLERDESMLKDIYHKWRSVLEAVEFSDSMSLRDCCKKNSTTHWSCPARDVCRIGSPETKAR